MVNYKKKKKKNVDNITNKLKRRFRIQQVNHVINLAAQGFLYIEPDDGLLKNCKLTLSFNIFSNRLKSRVIILFDWVLSSSSQSMLTIAILVEVMAYFSQ